MQRRAGFLLMGNEEKDNVVSEHARCVPFSCGDGSGADVDDKIKALEKELSS